MLGKLFPSVTLCKEMFVGPCGVGNRTRASHMQGKSLHHCLISPSQERMFFRPGVFEGAFLVMATAGRSRTFHHGLQLHDHCPGHVWVENSQLGGHMGTCSTATSCSGWRTEGRQWTETLILCFSALLGQARFEMSFTRCVREAHLPL